MTQLAHFGYRCGRLSASGQRRGSRQDEALLAGDIVAIATPDRPYCHYFIEVGGQKKSIRQALIELLSNPLPAGWCVMVVRLLPARGHYRNRWRYNCRCGQQYRELEAALDCPVTH